MSNLLTRKELEERKKRYQRYKTDPWDFSKAYKSADDVGGLLQHIEELEKALEQAAYVSCLFLRADGYFSVDIRSRHESLCPELANWLRTKEAGEGEKDA